MNEKFDLNKALEAIKAAAKIDSKDGVPTLLIEQLTEMALEVELETHLSNEVHNRKNGRSSKTMKSSISEFDLGNGTFESQFIKKHQIHMSYQIEHKILLLYALGNGYMVKEPSVTEDTAGKRGGLSGLIGKRDYFSRF